MVATRRRTISLSSAAKTSKDEAATASARRRTRSLSLDADSKDGGVGQSSTTVDEEARTEMPPRRRRSRSRGENHDELTKETGEAGNIAKIDSHLHDAHQSEERILSDDEQGNMNDYSTESDHAESVRTKNSMTIHKSSESKTQTRNGNVLTHLIPGYTAPMKLNTSSLDKFRPSGGIRELQRRAERTDASTKHFVLGARSEGTKAMQKTPDGFLPSSYTASYSNFKQGRKRAIDNTAGKGWFGMKPSEMTEQVKTDLAVIRNRSYLDPKRFYKSSDRSHKIVQIGTVIEGPTEYFSSRLTKKQRRSNITEEIMADPSSADYAKRKFKQMSREKSQQAERRKLKPKRAKKFY